MVPRQEKYHEHVNNHQVDFTELIEKRMNNIIPVYDIDQLSETIKNYEATGKKVNRSWATMLKALIVIFDRIEQEKADFDLISSTIITMKELGAEIQKSEHTAGTIAKKLVNCNFRDGLTLTKETITQPYEDNTGIKKYKTIGTQISATYNWEK